MAAPPRARPLDAASVMSLLDAAYELGGDDARWLTRLTDASRPILEQDGAGVHAFFVDVSQGQGAFSTPMLRGGEASWARRWRTDWWQRFMLALDEQAIRSVCAFAPVSYATDLYAATRLQVPTLRELLQRQQLFKRSRPHLDTQFGYPDSFNLMAVDAAGRGLALVANRRRPSPSPPTRTERAVWGALCAHLAAAMRLRQRLRGQSLLEQSDAVVDERGKLVHLASGDAASGARQSLARAAPALDLLRGRHKRRDVGPQETLQLWRALYGGRFSVLDVFSREGKRYVVARRNEPGRPASSQSALTESELQVLSLWSRGRGQGLIAYELGVAASTVTDRLAASRQKLGARTPDELMTKARALLAGKAG